MKRECRSTPDACKEHPVDKNKTTIAIHVSHHRYTFILVLYDGNVLLNRFESHPVTGAGNHAGQF